MRFVCRHASAFSRNFSDRRLPLAVNPPTVENLESRVLLSVTPFIASVAATPVPMSGQSYYNWAYTINGSNFGSQSPFNGDNPNIAVGDQTRAWGAGFTGNAGSDQVQVDLTKWSNTQITIAGYTGDYPDFGQNWIGVPNDIIRITVDNPSTGLASNTYQLKLALKSVTATPPNSQTATTGKSTAFALGSFTQFGATGPYLVSINWGDGSAVTRFSDPAAGSIAAKFHDFAKAGVYMIGETVTDAKGIVSNTARFTVATKAPTGTLSGRVFADVNSNGVVDSGEPGLGLIQLHLESMAGTVLATATTNVLGDFSFSGLTAGTYVIKVVPVTGLEATKPTGGVLTIQLGIGQVSTTNLFGERAVSWLGRTSIHAAPWTRVECDFYLHAAPLPAQPKPTMAVFSRPDSDGIASEFAKNRVELPQRLH